MTDTISAGTADSLLALAEALERDALAGDAGWLKRLRKAALARFAELGVPDVTHEDWRFTSLRRVAQTAFGPAAAARVDAALLAPHLFDDAQTAARLVFVNGRLDAKLSRIPSRPGLRVAGLAAALREDGAGLEAHLGRYVEFSDRAFAALNTACFEDGPLLHVGREVAVEGVIHLVYVTVGGAQPAALFPRALLMFDASSEATVVETHLAAGDAPLLICPVTELIAADHARVDHYRAVFEPASATHLSHLRTQQGRSATVRSHALSIDVGLARHEVHSVLAGEGGDCILNGLYLVSGEQHVDNHLRVEHAAPRCHSWEYYKGVLDDRGRGVFAGRIFVHKDAQKTDAKQTNKSLLLSSEAQVDTRPQLEIFADDVKCTHGATIGQIDADAVFYLRSRGVPEQAARSLLVFAFAAECLEAVRFEPLRRQMHAALVRRLPQGELFREMA